MKRCSNEFYDRHALMQEKAQGGQTVVIALAIIGAYLCAELAWGQIFSYFGF